jgi:hypothetical protein
MKNYRIIFALALLSTFAATSLGQTRSKTESPENLSGKAVAVVRTTTPSPSPYDALRSGKLIYVTSSSLLVSAEVVEEKLLKRSEFQAMGLMLTRDPKAADITLELRHDVFTKYVYTAVDSKNKVVIAGGKLSSLGGTVAGKVAERFLKQLARARQNMIG